MKIYRILLIVLACTLAVSCGDNLADLNVDPNQSTSGGTGAEVFTSATGYYGIALEAYFNQNDALFAQYLAGGPGVALLDHERYFFEPADFNTEWSFSYLQALSDLSYVKANGNAGLAGVSEVMSVLIYQNLVDHYGNIPYFDALKGSPDDGEITAPGYDDAKAVYDDLVVRLDAAIALLSNEDGALSEDDLTIGDEDLIYGGDIDSWIAFANSLKLRILMRQSITDPSVGPQVIDLIANGTFIADEAGLARIPFGGAEGANYNPVYVRNEGGIGQFYVASLSTTDVLDDLADPRGLVIFDEAVTTGELTGLAQGGINQLVAPEPDDFSFPSAVAYGEANDVILMSHWEVFFLRAEAAMRFGTADDELTMFDEAVTAHFVYVGLSAVDAQNYLATIGYDPAASDLEKSDIMGVQKWISMNGFQESEGWIESRRFDQSPSNIFTNGIFQTPPQSVFGTGVFPSIRLYPQTELSFNANAPSGRTVTEKVFWDN